MDLIIHNHSSTEPFFLKKRDERSLYYKTQAFFYSKLHLKVKKYKN